MCSLNSKAVNNIAFVFLADCIKSRDDFNGKC